jgi:DNA-binding transcriptional ArsR family regulator
MAMTPRRVVGDAKRWKALSHPLRGEMLRHLDEHGPATSTTIAEALGENTGTTSYHLRVLADAGIIEEVPERAHGRERWWRTFPTDHREPDYDSLSPPDRAALDEWRAAQIPGELALVNRFIRDVRKHGEWARSSRADGYFTADGLGALFEEYLALLQKYGHTKQDAPAGARPMQLRMFYIPDEPAPPGEAEEEPGPLAGAPAEPERE